MNEANALGRACRCERRHAEVVHALVRFASTLTQYADCVHHRAYALEGESPIGTVGETFNMDLDARQSSNAPGAP
jgi:hypothetical protein